MDYTNLVLVLVITGLLWVIWKCYQRNESDKKEIALVEKEKDEYEELGKGLAEYNQKLQDRKEKAKGKILEMMEKKTKIGSQEVSKVFNISGASARRYFDDLEAEGKVKQTGKSGKNVHYSKV